MCDVVQMDAPAAKRAGARRPAPRHRSRNAPPDARPRRRLLARRRCSPARSTSSRRRGPGPTRSAPTSPPAGWNCRVIDALPWALARAASLDSGIEAGAPVAALDWGYGKSTISLIHNGVPVHVRSLKDCAFQTILETISTRTSPRRTRRRTAASKTRPRHREPGRPRPPVPSPDQSHRRPARTTARIASCRNSAARSISGAASPAENSPKSIFIFGGGGTLAGIGDRLTAATGHPRRALATAGRGIRRRRAAAAGLPARRRDRPLRRRLGGAMRNYVNLMSDAAQFRTAARVRFAAGRWRWPRPSSSSRRSPSGVGKRPAACGQEHEALEASYDPIRRLTTMNNELRNTAADAGSRRPPAAGAFPQAARRHAARHRQRRRRRQRRRAVRRAPPTRPIPARRRPVAATAQDRLIIDVDVDAHLRHRRISSKL